MTDAEWLAFEDPLAMLQWRLGESRLWDNSFDKATKRKLMLYGCACCRLVWNHIVDERSKRVVELVENFADGKGQQEELDFALAEAYRVATSNSTAFWPKVSVGAAQPTLLGVSTTSTNTAYILLGFKSQPPGPRTREAETLRPGLALLTNYVRDLFRPQPSKFVLPSEWQTAAVQQGAKVIYNERRWDEMPILADALEDAGCDDTEILSHLRGPGPHTRGCWALDLILGKA
jgi:hypothetical protein